MQTSVNLTHQSSPMRKIIDLQLSTSLVSTFNCIPQRFISLLQMSSDGLPSGSPLSPDAPIWYTPKHIDERCLEFPCQNYGFEDSHTSSITNQYQQDKLPLITYVDNAVELLSIDLHARHARRYVAISHVRSQGLGNSYSNSLPMCQISRLQSLVDKLDPSIPGPVPFWIDTLCIPLTAPGQYLAFEALYDVYRCADETIVLEDSVLNTPTRSGEQNMITIRDSQWAHRLWTIREGAIAKSLKVQFKDSALDMVAIIREYSCATNGRLVCRTGNRSKTSDSTMSQMAVDKFIDQLQLLERDLRAAMDRIPPPPMSISYRDLGNNTARTEREFKIRVVLRHCYLSVPLYRYFVTETEAAGFLTLRTTVDATYKNLTYDTLLSQEKTLPTETLKRLDKILSQTSMAT